MGRRSKQTSCFACVEAKRRCDKTYPSCLRCISREIACTYPLVQASRQCLRPVMGGIAAATNAGHEDLLAPLALCGGSGALGASLACTASVSSSSSNAITNYFTPGQFVHLNWFLQPHAWTVAFHYHPPDNVPPISVFSNFVRGLQDWLYRFVRNGHSPFIHRHLYRETGYPQCMQDAYSSIAMSKTTTPENEHIVDEICSTYLSNLIDHQNAEFSMAFTVVSTRDHLSRTQALLIHILLALFSSSIYRRARAESLLGTLHMWTNQLWESATQDAMFASPLLNGPSVPGDFCVRGIDPVPELYRAFILSESVRRTWLLCNLATGVYSSLKGEFTETCGGDIHITTYAELWEAPSSARWEAIARHNDPLFIYSLRGQTLVERGVSASQVDEFARHLFTVMWGMEKVESWIVRTGDAVSTTY